MHGSHHDTIALKDGRRLAFRVDGPPDGFPVLYLHGAVGSSLPSSPALDVLLDELGARHVSVSRPGFGGSCPHPGRTLRTFAGDITELVDALGAERAAVLGVSAGGPYALACAGAVPERIAAAAVVSSLVPGGAPHAAKGMPAHLRHALRLLARHPDVVERLGSPLLALAARHPGWLTAIARRGTPAADRDRLAADGGAEATNAFLTAVAAGTRGLIDDYLVSCEPWDFAAEEVEPEIHLWHGEQDHVVPVQGARSLAARLPSCRAHFDARDGHFFYRRRLPEVLGALMDAVRPQARRIAHEPVAA